METQSIAVLKADYYKNKVQYINAQAANLFRIFLIVALGIVLVFVFFKTIVLLFKVLFWVLVMVGIIFLILYLLLFVNYSFRLQKYEKLSAKYHNLVINSKRMD